MGLSNNQRHLIMAIATNDMLLAKKHAINCLAEDTTVKNEWFTKKYKAVLETPSNNLMELPANLKGLLLVEDLANSFKESRYYLSEREKAAYDKIVRMKKVNERLLELGISYINSTLLYGESGTGKTSFGRYIAYKMGLPFCYLNFSNILESYMGNTSKNIAKAFSYAITNPCVFMLDEIDCISIRRSGGSDAGSDGEMSRTTIGLMQEFDKLPSDVIVIGATNRFDRIDEALLRRFSVKHEVKPLCEQEKINLIKNYLSDINFSVEDEIIEMLAKDTSEQGTLINKLISVIAETIENTIG